jgi:thiol-disulfide isomerase/thioredoxin
MQRGNARVALRGVLVAGFAALLGAASLGAYPAKGTTAPALDSLELLQAPGRTKADWASLRGKVVVLEFWATWCSPCVASLPHLNQLVESLDPAKFQFLSVDDEDRKAVETFLAKKKMAGWVGVDASGSVFAAYGIRSRPTSVIVDGNGKIVAFTEIDAVTADDLEQVAEGKTVAFKPAEEIITASSGALPTGGQPLFAVSVSKALPDAKESQIQHPPTGTDFLGVDVDTLLVDVLDPFTERYELAGPLPDGRYDLRVNFVDVPRTVMTASVEQAVLAALHLQIQSKTVSKPAYILRATNASKKLLSASASTHATKRGSWHDFYILMNGTMDDLAYVLATGLETQVVNETGIEGKYDARFKAAGSDVDSLNAALKANLGLELVPGTQVMPITVLEVSKQGERGVGQP